MMNRREPSCQVVRRVHQCNVRESLGKVAGLTMQLDVILLRKKTDIIAQSEDTLKEISRFSVATLQNIVVGEPEAARDKRSLGGIQSVDRRRSFITCYQSITQEAPFNCGDSPADSRILRRQESDHGQEKKAPIQRLTPKILDKRSYAGIESALTHFVVNSVPQWPPAIQWDSRTELFGRANCP